MQSKAIGYNWVSTLVEPQGSGEADTAQLGRACRFL